MQVVFDKAFHPVIDKRWQTGQDLQGELDKIMTESSTQDDESFDAIREELERHPGFELQKQTKHLYRQFMEQTRIALQEIRSVLGKEIAQEKQGGARQDEVNGTFGSHFGIVIPGHEVYLRLEGLIIGDELVMKIEDDNTTVARLSAQDPEWNDYREQLTREIRIRLARKVLARQ